jgi:hypothetical protein
VSEISPGFKGGEVVLVLGKRRTWSEPLILTLQH